MVVSDQAALEVTRQVGQVDLVSWQVGGARRSDCNGPLSQHVIHDGQVVDGEVPQHVDVALEEPQIDTR